MNNERELNEEQLEAVETIEGPLLVLAGAGSGKTRVVTYRIARLLEKGIPSSEILGVTFTNKAAQEMQERVRSLTNSSVLISTFHSLGARILRESIHAMGYKNDFIIYDEDDAYKLLRSILDELGIKDKKLEPKAFKQLISKAKNNMQSPEKCTLQNSSSVLEQLFPKIYEKYASYLKEYNALDFDDLLYLVVKLFKEHREVLEQYQDRWNFLLIDEYQDTNQAQYEMVKMLISKTNNIFVVGDPDQSIYSWRGANIQNILNFEGDFPGAKIIRLEQNYRSRANILEAANGLIGYNDNRYDKKLWSDLGQGQAIGYFTADTEKEEANFVAKRIYDFYERLRIPLKDIVVFYRTNSQSRVFEDRFLSQKIPYVIVGGLSFYQRREIKDILAFLKVVHSASDFISFTRTINIPKRGIGQTTIEKIRLGSFQEGLSVLDYCEKAVSPERGSLLFPLKLTAKQKSGLEEYLKVIKELKRIACECSLKEVVMNAIELSGYLNVLMQDRETFEDRKANLDELITKAIEWELGSESPSLGAFLEELSLKSTLDETAGAEDRVNLMTIHNGKGLEFPVVFLVGMEEDLFPHANARGSREALEEERRLCYVGVTRAKEYLFLTNARSRYLWGTPRLQRASRFIKEIPQKYIEKIRSGENASFTSRTSQEAALGGFSEGDAIYHNSFGVGIIQEVFNGSLGLAYKIFFSKDNDLKTIIAKYSTLTKL